MALGISYKTVLGNDQFFSNQSNFMKDKKNKNKQIKKTPIIYKATGVKIVVWGLGGQASEFEKQS